MAEYRVSDELREQYATLKSEPWFEMLLEYYENRSDHDDEATMKLIEEALALSLRNWIKAR
jgi:hypothetical protein